MSTSRYASDGLEFHVGELLGQLFGLDVFEDERHFALPFGLVSH